LRRVQILAGRKLGTEAALVGGAIETATHTPSLNAGLTPAQEQVVLEDLGKAITSLEKDRKLPSWYITKEEAGKLNWERGKDLSQIELNISIGGNIYNNDVIKDTTERAVPIGTTYTEADLGYRSGKRNNVRMIYGKNGKVYISRHCHPKFTVEIK
jgi:hypothetical protein